MQYPVKKLAQISGVSIRTLHHYDKIGLLKPSVRTEARYRLYGEAELLRLQQILFYKELDFPLAQIASILDDPDFNTIDALESHRISLQCKAEKISQLLKTIDNTILKLKGTIMLNDEELYAGLSKETVSGYREQITDTYGADVLERSEKTLKKMRPADFEKLKADFNRLYTELAAHRGNDPESHDVQTLIGRHYELIRIFWGTSGSADLQIEMYKGLGDLYVREPSYAKVDGKPDAPFAAFMRACIYIFAGRL